MKSECGMEKHAPIIFFVLILEFYKKRLNTKNDNIKVITNNIILKCMSFGGRLDVLFFLAFSRHSSSKSLITFWAFMDCTLFFTQRDELEYRSFGFS